MPGLGIVQHLVRYFSMFKSRLGLTVQSMRAHAIKPATQMPNPRGKERVNLGPGSDLPLKQCHISILIFEPHLTRTLFIIKLTGINTCLKHVQKTRQPTFRPHLAPQYNTRPTIRAGHTTPRTMQPLNLSLYLPLTSPKHPQLTPIQSLQRHNPPQSQPPPNLTPPPPPPLPRPRVPHHRNRIPQSPSPKLRHPHPSLPHINRIRLSPRLVDIQKPRPNRPLPRRMRRLRVG